MRKDIDEKNDRYWCKCTGITHFFGALTLYPQCCELTGFCNGLLVGNSLILLRADDHDLIETGRKRPVEVHRLHHQKL